MILAVSHCCCEGIAQGNRWLFGSDLSVDYDSIHSIQWTDPKHHHFRPIGPLCEYSAHLFVYHQRSTKKIWRRSDDIREPIAAPDSVLMGPIGEKNYWVRNPQSGPIEFSCNQIWYSIVAQRKNHRYFILTTVLYWIVPVSKVQCMDIFKWQAVHRAIFCTREYLCQVVTQMRKEREDSRHPTVHHSLFKSERNLRNFLVVEPDNQFEDKSIIPDIAGFHWKSRI